MYAFMERLVFEMKERRPIRDSMTGTAILRAIFIELGRRVRVKFPKS